MVNDELLISVLLNASDAKKAAKAANVSVRTIYHKLKDAKFCEKLDAAKREIISGCTTDLIKALSDAARVTRSILNDETLSAQTRLNAANLIFSNALKYNEMTDIEKRLDALERKADE